MDSTTTSSNPYVKLAMGGYPDTKQFATLIMFKLIKTTDWKAQSGAKGTTLTLAFKGRVFNVNKDDFEKIKIVKDVVTLGEPFEMIKEQYTNSDGNVKIGLRLKPVLGFDLADC